MSLVIPDSLEVIVLNNILNTTLSLRLFGNNITPAHGDSTSLYTQIAGGGYAAKSLVFGDWTITPGEPSKGVVSVGQTWTFTGVINAPGTVYGYYLVRTSDSQLILAERFPSGSVPFSPVAGSKIAILPRITAQSEF